MADTSTRPGAQHLIERRRKRRRRRAALSIGAMLVMGGASAAWMFGAPPDDSAADATDDTVDDAQVDGLSTASPSETTASITTTTTTPTTTTTAPPNDLIAPPPTVVPSFDTSDGLAPFVHRVDTTDRVIFITIDDGQFRDPTYLDHFAQLGVPFTSFLTQPMAQADPAYWQTTQQHGGSIQTHTINHPNLRAASEQKVRREVCEPADAFAFGFGTRPTLFRPPYGNSNDTVLRIAAECGYWAVVHWSGSTNNGKLTMQDVALQPGDIVLMHYRDTLHADLDDVVARARAEGFKIGRLEDYLAPAP